MRRTRYSDDRRLVATTLLISLALCGLLLALIPASGMAANIPQASTPPRVIVAYCPNYGPGYACADGDTMWIPRGAGPGVYWHEYAHHLDLSGDVPEWLRREYIRLTHESGDWWGDLAPATAGYHPPGERFADAFAECALNATGRGVGSVTGWSRTGKPRGVDSYYGYAVPWRVHRRVCRLTWRVFGLSWSAHLRAPCAPCSVSISRATTARAR